MLISNGTCAQQPVTPKNTLCKLPFCTDIVEVTYGPGTCTAQFHVSERGRIGERPSERLALHRAGKAHFEHNSTISEPGLYSVVTCTLELNVITCR